MGGGDRYHPPQMARTRNTEEGEVNAAAAAAAVAAVVVMGTKRTTSESRGKLKRMKRTKG